MYEVELNIICECGKLVIRDCHGEHIIIDDDKYCKCEDLE